MCVTVVILIELKSYYATTSQIYYIIWPTITIGTVLRTYTYREISVSLWLRVWSRFLVSYQWYWSATRSGGNFIFTSANNKGKFSFINCRRKKITSFSNQLRIKEFAWVLFRSCISMNLLIFLVPISRILPALWPTKRKLSSMSCFGLSRMRILSQFRQNMMWP